MQIKGILSFHSLFQTRRTKDVAGQPTGDPKFSCALLIPPGDPQIPVIQQIVDNAIFETFPNGFPAKGDKCWGLYQDKVPSTKDYYNPKFINWYVFSCTALEKDKPAVVTPQLQPIMDPAKVFSGAVVWVNAGISGYTKGTGGVGGWLNGVMITDEEPPVGRLDGRPSVEQMFANLPTSHQQHLAAGAPVQQSQQTFMHTAANGAQVTQPQFAAPPVLAAQPPIAAAPPVTNKLIMKPGLDTYENHIKLGWTDEMLLANNMATRPSFV